MSPKQFVESLLCRKARKASRQHLKRARGRYFYLDNGSALSFVLTPEFRGASATPVQPSRTGRLTNKIVNSE